MKNRKLKISIAVILLIVFYIAGINYFADYKDKETVSVVKESLEYIAAYEAQYDKFPSGKNFYENFYYKNYPKESGLIVPRVMYSDGVYPYPQVKNNPGFAGQKKAIESVQKEMDTFIVDYSLSRDRSYRIGDECKIASLGFGPDIIYYCIIVNGYKSDTGWRALIK